MEAGPARKSISIDCLRKLGFVAACRNDLAEHGALRFKEWIYNRSLPIFEAAFASDVPLYGGCGPPMAMADAAVHES